MAKKHSEGYLSGKESRRISKENRKITSQLEKQHKRKNVPESEYLTQMHNPIMRWNLTICTAISLPTPVL